MQYAFSVTDRLYLRISLDTAASGSIDKQRETLAPLTRPGAVEYIDRSVSGSKVPFAERPAGSRLVADLRSGDRLLVTKIDRAARSTEDLLSLIKRVNAIGAEVVFAAPYISTEGPMGRLLLTVFGAVAEFEADLISERRRESLEAFRHEGRHAVGSAPFGLRSVPNPNGRGLVLRPDPATAPRLRDAVKRILTSEVTQAQAAASLGIGAPGFSRLLRNERLAGVVGHETDGSPRVEPDAAVFSLVEWAALQEHLTRPVKAWTKADGYGAALACAVCGERLYLNVAKRREHSVYRCRRVRHTAGEPGVSVIASNADRAVEEEFLATFGRLPVTEAVVVSTSDARARAVAAARLRLDVARRAQDAAITEEDDDEADRAYKSAKRALREAESLPDESAVEYRETGETFAEVWERADRNRRTALLLRAGRWIVVPGRVPLAQKITREDAEPDYLAGEALYS